MRQPITPVKDIAGQVFGRLLVVERRGSLKTKAAWLCKCSCGNEKITTGDRLRQGSIASCGCLRIETQGKTGITHGDSGTRLHRIWKAMKARCLNPKTRKFPVYGGRGITVCEEWKCDFVSFRDWSLANGYSEELEIDRRNNDLGYSPENCRWVTHIVNSNNTSRNWVLDLFGEKRTAMDWSRDGRCAVPYTVLILRLQRGWEPLKAVTTPKIRHSRVS